MVVAENKPTMGQSRFPQFKIIRGPRPCPPTVAQEKATIVAENKPTPVQLPQSCPKFRIIRDPGWVRPPPPTREQLLDKRIDMHMRKDRPMPLSLVKEIRMDDLESPGDFLRQLKNNTFPDEHTGTTLTSEPTATSSSVASRPPAHRFRRCTPVTSVVEPTTVTTTSEPTATTSSVVSHNTRSRFRRCTPVSSAAETTTVTTTTASRGSHSTQQSVRPDPVRQATPPPPPPPPAPQPCAQKSQRRIEIDHLPGGIFPRVGNQYIYDTSPETMQRTSSEDYSIWKWVMKWGTGYGDAGLPWQCLREWQWRKRSACAREKLRKEEAQRKLEAQAQRKLEEEAHRNFLEQQEILRQEAWEQMEQMLAKRRFARRLGHAAILQAAREPIAEHEESDDHSTIMSGILNLASHWSGIIARRLGFRPR